jgi:glycosyltransferase involved in cell wall biosynthesis
MQKHIVVHSYNAKLDLIKYLKIKEEYIKFIVDGVNTNIFNPNNYDHEIKKKYGENLIFYLGEFYVRKRIPVLLRAMPIIIKEIPDIHLVLIGEGEKHMLERAKQLAAKLNLLKHISFLGFQNDDVVLKFYATADVFVFPSELEGFGLVILESMASGTPVICANKPPMNILIGEGGVSFELNNYRDLAQKAILLLKNRELLNKLAEKSLQIAQKYDSLNIAKYYVEYIKEIKNSLKN